MQNLGRAPPTAPGAERTWGASEWDPPTGTFRWEPRCQDPEVCSCQCFSCPVSPSLLRKAPLGGSPRHNAAGCDPLNSSSTPPPGNRDQPHFPLPQREWADPLQTCTKPCPTVPSPSPSLPQPHHNSSEQTCQGSNPARPEGPQGRFLASSSSSPGSRGAASVQHP